MVVVIAYGPDSTIPGAFGQTLDIFVMTILRKILHQSLLAKTQDTKYKKTYSLISLSV